MPYETALRPHKRAEAMSAPWRSDCSFNHTPSSITHSRLVKVPKPQSRAGDHTLAVSHGRYRLLEPPRDYFWVLHNIGGGVDHARQQHHVGGQRIPAYGLVFMLMARVGELDAERADVGLVEHRQDQLEGDIVNVRPVPVGPSSNAAGRDRAGCLRWPG